MNTHRVPTDEQLNKLYERKTVCRYFYQGIFITRLNGLRKVIDGKEGRAAVEDRISNQIDQYYVCMTDGKLGGINEAPQIVQQDIRNAQSQVISQLLTKSGCEFAIDGIFRKLVYNKLM